MTYSNQIILMALSGALIFSACSKKTEGCKLDSECMNSQICRNMQCVANESRAQDANTQDASQNTENGDNKQAEEGASPLGLNDEFLQKTSKLMDRGLETDYVLDHEITLYDSQKLEIGPGVGIDMVSSSAGFTANDDATIIIAGTAQNPVVLKSSTNAVWNGINLNTKSKDNKLQFVNVIGAGGSEGAICLKYQSKTTIEHVIIDNSAQNGFYFDLDASSDKFENNTIKNCKQFPLATRNIHELAQLGSGNLYENNAKQYIQVDNASFSGGLTLKPQPVPYLFSGGIDANADSGSGEFILDKGVHMAFEYDAYMLIQDGILLKIKGTPDQPVIMRGIKDEDSFWNGVELRSSRPSEISGLVIQNAGKDENASLKLSREAQVKLNNITFKKNPNACLFIESDVKITNGGGLSFEECGKSNIIDERIDGDEAQRMIPALKDPAEI